MTGKQTRILSITLASWGIIMIGTGVGMNNSIKPIVETTYTLDINNIKVNESKTNEIILKEISIEINNPLSVNVKDYLENVDQIDNSTLKALKLDTSMVKTNEAGTYTYTISFKKKKYNGTIIVKEKTLPNIELKLKEINLEVGYALPIPNEANNYDYSFYVENELTDEMKKNMTLDISKVNTSIEKVYDYTIVYNGTIYQGKINVYVPRPKEVKHFCENYNNNYYNKEGNIVTKEEYEKSCEVKQPEQTTPEQSQTEPEESTPGKLPL